MTTCPGCRLRIVKARIWFAGKQWHPGCARVQQEKDEQRNLQEVQKRLTAQERAMAFNQERKKNKAGCHVGYRDNFLRRNHPPAAA